jgi:hypothetical protein
MVRRVWLGRAVDLYDVAIGIEEEDLGKTGGSGSADDETHRVVLRCIFAKTVGSH